MIRISCQNQNGDSSASERRGSNGVSEIDCGGAEDKGVDALAALA